ncbi:MAG: PAS-domain containing protein, partial [Hyphomonadaceae bacterium]|nr:PAS-domain containing protein [Hyphomonadaceae bacterium]
MLASAFAFRGALEYRPTSSGWRKRANELDARLSHMYAVLGSYRGLILVWEDDVPDTDTWGNPRIYGSPAAMASMQSFVEMGRPRDVPIRILDGLADLDSISEKGQPATLRANLARLRRNGKAFTVSIVLSEGNVIEANGRVAGRRVVLWLADTPIRGEDGRVAIDRFETGKLVLQDDPVASAEVLGRAPFPIWRVSGQGQLLWVNDSYAKAVGVETVTDVLEQQIYLDEQSARDMRDVLISKNRQETVRNLILNGELTATRILQFAISGGVVGMALDASELENLRQALNHHIRAHNEILNNMDEAVVTFGRGQTMRFHNRAFASLFHLEESWFKGQPTHGEWLDHLRETGRLPPVSDYRDWRQAELDLYTSWPDEVPPEIWTLPDGATLRLVRMRDPNGGISLLLSDITNTVTLQSQFNTLIKVHTATLDKLTEGIAVFGADGHLKIYNSAFASIWEIPEDSLSDNPSFS